MFFDPKDYLERDPTGAKTPVEAERLRRQAGQRAALCEAMTRLAAQHGFEAATAQRVFHAAELGSGTFYKLFEDREACLLTAFERCAGAIFARVAAATQAGGDDFADRLEAGLGELVGILAADPDVARLVLVEIRAGDSECREAQQRWLGRFAGLLGDGSRSDGIPRSGSLARMTAGGLLTLLTLTVVEKGLEALSTILEELTCVGQWPQRGAKAEASMQVEGTASDAGREPAKVAPSKGRAVRRRRTKSQRLRLLAAMTALAGEKGYEATLLTDVLERSALSRPVFYAHFGSKEECFLAAFDAAIERIAERVEEAVASEATATGRAEAGLRALVESLAEQPAVARLVTIEIRKLRAYGEARYDEALASFAQLFAEASGDRQAGADSEVAGLVAGAVAGAIAREVGEGRAAQLGGLLPELVFTAFAPCLGGERAAARARAVSGS
jgi:AcrR family transcriptional regulator